VTRLLVFATWRLALFGRLARTVDPVLAAVAAKGVKELTYHRDYAAQWAVRLGDGTDESSDRMVAALDESLPLTAELFAITDVERHLVEAGAAVDPGDLADEFFSVLGTVLAAATLPPPAPAVAGEPTGRVGVHTEALRTLLAEFQVLARADPEASW
jgi:ring-1,2-phenylacetyl-CoA epoxidase subunit PaaC